MNCVNRDNYMNYYAYQRVLAMKMGRGQNMCRDSMVSITFWERKTVFTKSIHQVSQPPSSERPQIQENLNKFVLKDFLKENKMSGYGKGK